MAAERTEEPTPKRLEEARRRGEVAVSRDATSAAALTAAIVALVLQGPALTARLLAYWKGAFAAATIAGGSASAALVAGHPRPAPAQRSARHPVDDQPVGAELAAVGLDRGIPDLRGEQGTEGGLTAQALVGAPVDPHHVPVAQPHLVAARAIRAIRDPRAIG